MQNANVNRAPRVLISANHALSKLSLTKHLQLLYVNTVINLPDVEAF